MLRYTILFACLLLALCLVADAGQAPPPVKAGHNAGFAAFLHDGKQIITVGDEDFTIRVWDVVSGKETRKIDLPVPEKQGAKGRGALSKDGKVIAAWFTSAPNEIYLHDVTTGKPLPSLKTPEPVSYAAFSSDGVHFAFSLADGTIRIWDWAKLKEIRSLPAGRSALAYGPDGKSIAAICPGLLELKPGLELKDLIIPPSARLWDAAEGTPIWTVGGKPSNGPGPYMHMAFSADGKWLAFITGNTPVLLDAGTGKEIGKLADQLSKESDEKGTGASFAAFAPDSKTLVGAVVGRGILEWDIATMKLLRSCKSQFVMRISPGYSSFSPDGKLLVTTGEGPPIFDVTPGKDITPLKGTVGGGK